MLGLHQAGGLAERPGEALGIDRRAWCGRELGDNCRGIKRGARGGKDLLQRS